MIPAPLSQQNSDGFLPLHPGDGVVLSPAFASVKDGILSLLPMLHASENGPVRFVPDGSLAEEAYAICCDGEEAVVTAGGAAGAVHGAAALAQLISERGVPCTVVSDAPYYAWRGMHFDPCRHFFPIETLYKLIDLAALYRLNRFHLHLSDDQGFRVESERFPLLNSVGSYRKSSVVKCGDGERQDGIAHGGYYKKDELRALVAYALARGVEIVPEIDLPGHSSALLAAYPGFACFPRKTEVETRVGIKDFSSHIICAGNEDAFAFLCALLDEVSELFPSKYFHIGGDEAGKAEWRKCETCQAKMRELGLSGERELQGWLLRRLADHMEARGKEVIVWNDGMTDRLTPDVICQHWTPKTVEGEKRTAAHLNAGGRAIMSGFRYLYLDYPYAMTPMKRCYEYDPVPAGLTDAGRKNILGVECALWTEWIADERKLFYNLLPRLAACAELAWCGPKRPGYRDYLTRLPQQYAIYEARGLPYAKGREKADGFLRRLRTVRTFFAKDAEIELR